MKFMFLYSKIHYVVVTGSIYLDFINIIFVRCWVPGKMAVLVRTKQVLRTKCALYLIYHLSKQ